MSRLAPTELTGPERFAAGNRRHQKKRHDRCSGVALNCNGELTRKNPTPAPTALQLAFARALEARHD